MRAFQESFQVRDQGHSIVFQEGLEARKSELSTEILHSFQDSSESSEF